MKDKKIFITEQFNRLSTIEDKKQFNNYIQYQLSLLLDSDDYIEDMLDFTKLINSVMANLAKDDLIENNHYNGICTCISKYNLLEVGAEYNYTRGISNYKIITSDKKYKLKKEDFEKYFEIVEKGI